MNTTAIDLKQAAKYEFIELGRTFRELSEYSGKDDDSDFGHAFRLGERLTWTDLLAEYRLILLSEAGAGKTAEIRNVARRLRAEGRSAFFLRLEHIPSDFEDAFEVGTFEEFEEWMSSGQEGWMLLDSVDEARLRNPADFELAIRKLGRRINAAKDRTHIVITGRTTAWRPMTDLAHCVNHLPYMPRGATQAKKSEADVCLDLTVLTNERGKTPPMFRIVALDDLSSDQIASFARARGINDSTEFLEAIERADAWSFTSRPQDLAELTEFWLDKGRIGSRLEIMRNSIERRLAERDQDRADSRPLAADRARTGAKLLAVAATLAQSQVLRVPDGADNPNGLDVRSILADWDDKDQATLLSRPIFDEAIYGTVRFHHRSVREYLTAEWFSDLLARQTSRRSIEALFFREQYGMDIVVPKLRPVLPWLAILDDRIRERIRKVAPEIIFEGGDPSQLPLDVRRYILHEVCEQMAGGAVGRSMRDYAAVQRFANTDLADDVRTLVGKYADNDDLASFLLRMVWLGELKGVRREALEIAMKSDAEQYLRIAAFRAVRAVGTADDQLIIRQRFLTEADELNRDWLAELVEGIQLSAENITWLVSCLEKSAEKQRYSVDHLTDRLEAMITSANVDLLSPLVSELNRLLGLSPVVERRNCEVSEKFQWLITPAAKAVERLVIARQPAATGPDALGVLSKLSAIQGYGIDDAIEVKAQFEKLVPAWPELNQALFWFEVHQSRETIDRKRGETLTEFWQASLYGSFAQFGPDDFNYVAGEIARRTLLDDRKVALSLAFNLYVRNGRPNAWRELLKKLTGQDAALADRLANYLKPPPRGSDYRRMKQMEEKWKRRDKARKEKEAEYHAGWKKYFNTSLTEARTAQEKAPGEVTNALYYLFQQTRNNSPTSGRWTAYNWKELIHEYGDEVAKFYRDSAVELWKNYKPKLISEGAALNRTAGATIIGLAGLEIEFIESSDQWPVGLSSLEVEHACRHASFELNGFPIWFPRLFAAFPTEVSEFLMQEILYELTLEKVDQSTHYIISDVSWSGAWAWDTLGPRILAQLRKDEPKNLDNLDKLLTILQGSSVPDAALRDLAVEKCENLKNVDHLARWFAVWTGVEPERSIEVLRARLVKLRGRQKKVQLAMTFVTHLWGGRSGDVVSTRQAYKTPDHLKSLYLLVHEYVRIGEDINRAGTGVYSPGLRDNAQEARNRLFELLNKIPGKEAFLALLEVAKSHPEESFRPWLLHHAKMKAEQDGDTEPWTIAQVREFAERVERTPANHRELAELAHLRLLDLRDDLENGDSGIASILLGVTQETEMRKYIGHDLREKAQGRYSIPQEEELGDAKRPDLRFHGVKFDGPVPVELKLADKWTGPALFERLENQLCGDYLRDNRSNRGFFVLVYRGEKAGWDIPGSENRVDFSGLVESLQNHWSVISSKFPNVEAIEVVGINLTARQA
ncbi:NACHT domain-containing protein [Noviherbaspirillum sp. ST9]|uniref:NACHT domain-containing protein n=1 Tax=Noviherbaspirillum sp. ST9 TaxID=3401606 RepID=UPI003B589567